MCGKCLFSGDHPVPALDVRATGQRLLPTVWKPHLPDGEGNTFRLLFSSTVFIHVVSFVFCLVFRVRVTWFLSGLQVQRFTSFSPS